MEHQKEKKKEHSKENLWVNITYSPATLEFSMLDQRSRIITLSDVVLNIYDNYTINYYINRLCMSYVSMIYAKIPLNILSKDNDSKPLLINQNVILKIFWLPTGKQE